MPINRRKKLIKSLKALRVRVSEMEDDDRQADPNLLVVRDLIIIKIEMK